MRPGNVPLSTCSDQLSTYKGPNPYQYFVFPNPLSTNIHIKILQTDFHMFPWRISWENLLTDQGTIPLVINLLILMTFSVVYVLVIVLEKIDVGHS